MSASNWDLAWWSWLGVTAGSFTVLEYASLQTKDPHAPFSFQLRRWAGLHPRSIPRRLLFCGLLGAGELWLVRHLLDIPIYDVLE